LDYRDPKSCYRAARILLSMIESLRKLRSLKLLTAIAVPAYPDATNGSGKLWPIESKSYECDKDESQDTD
jgi:hypothetical protein